MPGYSVPRFVLNSASILLGKPMIFKKVKVIGSTRGAIIKAECKQEHDYGECIITKRFLELADNITEDKIAKMCRQYLREKCMEKILALIEGLVDRPETLAVALEHGFPYYTIHAILRSRSEPGLDAVGLALIGALMPGKNILTDIMMSKEKCGFYVSYYCNAPRDYCEYVAMNVGESLERLPDVRAVIASFNYPRYEFRAYKHLSL